MRTVVYTCSQLSVLKHSAVGRKLNLLYSIRYAIGCSHQDQAAACWKKEVTVIDRGSGGCRVVQCEPCEVCEVCEVCVFVQSNSKYQLFWIVDLADTGSPKNNAVREDAKTEYGN